MEEEDRELLRLAAQAGCEEEIRSFGRLGRESILRRHEPKEALKRMMGILEGLEDLKVAEKSIDTSLVRRILQSGWIQVMGRDKAGRPVIWEQSKIPNTLSKASGDALKEECTAYTLVWAWVLFFALRKRLSHTRGVTYIFDCREVGILSRLATIGIFTSYMRRILPDPPIDSRLVVFNTAASALFLRAYLKLLPSSYAQTLSVISSPNEICDELENPGDFPDWFEPGGRPYALSSETHGEYKRLLDGYAFASLGVFEIYHMTGLSAERLEESGESEGSTGCALSRSSSSESQTQFTPKSGSMKSDWSRGSSASFVSANGEHLI